MVTEKEMGENNDAEVEGDVGEVRVCVTYVSRGALPWGHPLTP